jgi:hypothetical protein
MSDLGEINIGDSEIIPVGIFEKEFLLFSREVLVK